MNIWKNIERKQFSSLYLLYGTESFIINETKQKLVANVLTDEEAEFNLAVYDMEETPVETAIEDAETLPFLGDRKLIFVQNPGFLTAEKTKEKVEHNLQRLETFLEDPPPYSIVVFTGPYEKLDERKKLTKLLKKKAEVVEAKKPGEGELKSWMREQAAANGVSISDEAADRLLAIAGTDQANLAMEIRKLALYSQDTKEIGTAAVEKLTSKSLEQNVFSLIDKVVGRRIDEALRMYYDLLKLNEEPIKILALVSGQFRLIYQVKALQKRGYGQKQIAGQLKVHPYRVKLAAGQAHSFTEDTLCTIIDLLSDVDLQLKTSAMDKKLPLELFLLKLHTLKM